MRFSDGLFAKQSGDGISPDTKDSQGRALSPGATSKDTGEIRKSAKLNVENSANTQISLSLAGFKEIDLGMLLEYKNLVELDLQGTEIKELPKELEKLRFLKKLKAGSNSMETITYCPSNLELLTLDRNKLTDCSYLFQTLSQLVLLDLSHNLLTSCAGIAECSRLRYLNLKHNQIASGVEELAMLAGLQEVDLSSNCISDIDAIMKLCAGEDSNLQVLNFQDNPCLEL